MIAQERAAVFAAARLAVVVAAILGAGAWWLVQKAPDYRVDVRVRLSPDNEVERMGPVALEHQVRDAWKLPVNEVARFGLVVPGEGATLRFHEGALQGQPDLSVRLVRGNGRRTELGRITASQGTWAAHRMAVPVVPGEEVDLELVAVDGEGRPGLGIVVLADVVLESDGRPVDETERPVLAESVVTDLLAAHSLDMRTAPATTESARADMPGPLCLPLEPQLSRVLDMDKVPDGSLLHVVLHVSRISVEGIVPSARVKIFAGKRMVANVRVDEAVRPLDGPRVQELLVNVDLARWARRPLVLRFELEGGENLFVGLRELFVTKPQRGFRRPFEPGASHNVLLVVVDGLRADRLGAWGYTKGHTPVIDGLAARGLRYSHLIGPSSWSLPNVASLLTGSTPVTHGLGASPDRVLSSKITTLAQSASWAGFTTACFTTTEVIGEETGLDRGYETVDHLPVPAVTRVEGVLDWLAEASQFEWFVTVHVDDPVYPHEPESALLSLVEQGPDPELVKRLRPLDSRPGAAEALAMEVGTLYDAEVAGVDRAIGLLLDGLSERGLLDDTLVVVVGAHGQEFFEHNGRLQGQSLFDEVVRLPLVLAGPGISSTRPPPLVENEMIELVDVTRLVGQIGGLLAGVTPAGRVPPPFGPRQPDAAVHAVLHPFPGLTRRHLEASRRGGLLHLRDQATGAAALFDLTEDPGATRNLLGDPDDRWVWKTESDALAEAFNIWYRDAILGSEARPVLWTPPQRAR